MIGRKKVKEQKNNEVKEKVIEPKKRKSIFTWPFRLVIKILKRIFKKFMNSALGIKLMELSNYIYERIQKSIRFELVIVFAICFALSVLFYSFSGRMLSKNQTVSNLAYDIDSIKSRASTLAERINGLEEEEVSEDELNEELENNLNTEASSNEQVSNNEENEKSKVNEEIISLMHSYSNINSKVFITDLDGNILFRVNSDIEDKLDIYNVLYKINNVESVSSEQVFLYPVQILEDKMYLVYYETPEAYIVYDYYTDENAVLSLFLSVIIFISLFMIITNKKMKYVEEIELGLRVIQNGNLSYRIEEKGNDEIRNLARNINNMAKEINNRIENERNSEKTKSELITNVSHDLRTPLTSVMGYIGLVKDGKYESEETMREYLSIAFNKSNQLKNLIDDLFEYTKLNNNGVVLETERVNIVGLLSQIAEEYIYVLEDNNLEIETDFRSTQNILELDPSKIVRVFENLLMNAIKYSLKPGKINLSTYEKNGSLFVKITNKGESISKEKLSKLFDRFYRVDEARNSNINGSGLGLAISKNIVELHNGEIWADSKDNHISFYVRFDMNKEQ